MSLFPKKKWSIPLKPHCDETRAADNDPHANSWKEEILYRATAD